MFRMRGRMFGPASAVAIALSHSVAYASAVQVDMQAAVPVVCAVENVSHAANRQTIVIDLTCNAESFSLSLVSPGALPNVTAVSVRHGTAATSGGRVDVRASRPGGNTVTLELDGGIARIERSMVSLAFAG